MIMKAQAVMAGEGNRECDHPADDVGGQRSPAQQVNNRDDHAPMHGRGTATDDHEPADSSALLTHRRAEVALGERRSAAHLDAQHNEDRVICICLDDFGLSAGINQAALQLARQGRLQAVSCMVGTAFFKAGAAHLRQLGPIHIDVGLHLDLTEAPLLPTSRRSLRGLVFDSLLGRVDRLALREEIRMQLDTFEQTLGRAPDHIDGHQHVHQLPGVRDELLDELTLRSATVRPWLRSTRSAAQGGSWRARFKPLVIEQLGDAALRAAAAKRGFRQNRHLLGVYNFQGGAQAYVSQLERWLQVAGPGDLLICHAGLGEVANDPIATARRAEWKVLSSQRFADLIAARQVKMQPMSDILVERGASG